MLNKIKTVLFWIWQITWGGLMTIPGLLITLGVILFGGTPHKNGRSYIVEVGGDWGGLELGGVALCGRYRALKPKWYDQTRKHEYGHNLQNMIFGPFTLFVVTIPSAIRYWLRSYGNYDDQVTYGRSISTVILTLAVGVIGLGIVTAIWVQIIGWALFGYGVLIIAWLCKEIPKYSSEWPDYDDFWIEGWATRWGSKVIEEIE